MLENRAERASEHALITKIWLSDRYGVKTPPMMVVFEYCCSRLEGDHLMSRPESTAISGFSSRLDLTPPVFPQKIPAGRGSQGTLRRPARVTQARESGDDGPPPRHRRWDRR